MVIVTMVTKRLLPSRGSAGSSLRSLSNIPHCCHPTASGPYLNPSVADQPFRSTKDLWLGQLLPNQLPNPTKAHPLAVLCLYVLVGIRYNIKLIYILS